MLKFNNPGIFEICGRSVIFEIGSPPKDAKDEDNHWTARAWIDASDGPVYDHDLDICLLDDVGDALAMPSNRSIN